MLTIEKVLAVTFKDIGTAFHTIDVQLASRFSREYSIAKVNYYYDKIKKDIEEWLAEINQIIEANNMTRVLISFVNTELNWW